MKKLVLDVTTIDPPMRHPLIFRMFDEMDDGDTLTISNDHDPKPLYFQMVNERGKCFSWQYMLQGPSIWEVLITKELKEKGETIGEMARKDYRKAGVFKKLGIDFCCGGKKTIEEACKINGLDPFFVKSELSKAAAQNVSAAAQHDYDAWSLSFLSDYIINVHHAYIRNNAQLLDELSEKVATKHGGKFEELVEVRRCVSALLQELLSHLPKEEKVLFPYIKEMESRLNGKDQNVYCNSFNSVQQPVWVMEQEHEVAGNLLKQLRAVTKNYAVPPNACNSFNFLYKKLEEFEADLHQHIHLENNILFPKAIQLEQEIKRM